MNTEKLIYKLINTGFVKVLSACSGLLLTFLVTRNISVDAAGKFLFVFSLFISFSTVLRAGMDNILLRNVASSGLSDHSRFIYKKSLFISFVLSFFIIFFLVLLYSLSNFSQSRLFLIFSLCLPFYCFQYISSFVFQGLNQYNYSVLFQNLAINSVFSLIIFILVIYSPSSLSANTFSVVFFISCFLISVICFLILYKQAGVDFTYLICGKSESDSSFEYYVESRNQLWLASITSVLVQWSGVVIGGFLLKDIDVALLSVSQRLALLISFLLMIVNIVVAPRFAFLWKENRRNELEVLAKKSTFLLSSIVTPFMFVLFFFSGEFLSIFGDDYSQGETIFRILIIGQFANLATGSVGYLLNMTGHDKDIRNCTLVSGVYAVIACLILTQTFGVIGTAVSTASSVFIQNFLLSFFVYKRLGFAPIAFFPKNN